MDPYAMAQAAAPQAAPAAPAAQPAQAAQAAAPAGTPGAWGGDASAWGMQAAGQWGAGAAGGWDPSAAAAWGGVGAAWGGYGGAPSWGGDAWGGKGGNDAWGGKGGKGGGKGGAGKGMGMRFQPYGPKRYGPTYSIKIQPLPEGIAQKELSEAFSSYGDIASVRIMQGEPNFAYVNFTTTAAAANAIAVKQIELGGSKCWINPGKPKYPDATESIGLFNLPYSANQEQLDKLLNGFAGFKKVKMINKPGTTEFRGFAFADFDTVDNAVAALEGLTGTWVGDKAIDVKFSQSAGNQQGGGPGWGKGGKGGKGDDQWGGGSWGNAGMNWGQGGGSWW